MSTTTTTSSILRPPAGLSTRDRVWGLGSALAVVAGSLGPWATLGPFTKHGTGGDGLITLVLGLAVLTAIWLGRLPVGVLVLGIVIALIGIADTIDVGTSVGGILSPGWGVVLTAAAGISVAAWGAVAVRGRLGEDPPNPGA